MTSNSLINARYTHMHTDLWFTAVKPKREWRASSCALCDTPVRPKRFNRDTWSHDNTIQVCACEFMTFRDDWTHLPPLSSISEFYEWYQQTGSVTVNWRVRAHRADGCWRGDSTPRAEYPVLSGHNKENHIKVWKVCGVVQVESSNSACAVTVNPEVVGQP